MEFMVKLFRTGATGEWSDEELLSKYQDSGDMAYLGKLYERYMPMVLGLCLKLMKDKSKAEDAVMGIFESIVEKARTHEIANFRPWLYVTARNFCLMEFRKNNRNPIDLHEPENMARFDDTEDQLEFELPSSGGDALAKCIEALADVQKTCIELFYFKEKSYKEIAEKVGEDLGKVRSFIQNGRRNLKNCLEKKGINKTADHI